MMAKNPTGLFYVPVHWPLEQNWKRNYLISIRPSGETIGLYWIRQCKMHILTCTLKKNIKQIHGWAKKIDYPELWSLK